jgi:hypothetical protein
LRDVEIVLEVEAHGALVVLVGETEDRVVHVHDVAREATQVEKVSPVGRHECDRGRDLIAGALSLLLGEARVRDAAVKNVERMHDVETRRRPGRRTYLDLLSVAGHVGPAHTVRLRQEIDLTLVTITVSERHDAA